MLNRISSTYAATEKIVVIGSSTLVTEDRMRFSLLAE